MRNQPQPVTAMQTRMTAKLARVLDSAQKANRPVTVAYTKRDGTESKSTGKVGEYSGEVGYDTFSVTIHTDNKGPRTINLCRVKMIGM